MTRRSARLNRNQVIVIDDEDFSEDRSRRGSRDNSKSRSRDRNEITGSRLRILSEIAEKASQMGIAHAGKSKRNVVKETRSRRRVVKQKPATKKEQEEITKRENIAIKTTKSKARQSKAKLTKVKAEKTKDTHENKASLKRSISKASRTPHSQEESHTKKRKLRNAKCKATLDNVNNVPEKRVLRKRKVAQHTSKQSPVSPSKVTVAKRPAQSKARVTRQDNVAVQSRRAKTDKIPTRNNRVVKSKKSLVSKARSHVSVKRVESATSMRSKISMLTRSRARKSQHNIRRDGSKHALKSAFSSTSVANSEYLNHEDFTKRLVIANTAFHANPHLIDDELEGQDDVIPVKSAKKSRKSLRNAKLLRTLPPGDATVPRDDKYGIGRVLAGSLFGSADKPTYESMMKRALVMTSELCDRKSADFTHEQAHQLQTQPNLLNGRISKRLNNSTHYYQAGKMIVMNRPPPQTRGQTAVAREATAVTTAEDEFATEIAYRWNAFNSDEVNGYMERAALDKQRINGELDNDFIRELRSSNRNKAYNQGLL